jgi:hypothetical protein
MKIHPLAELRRQDQLEHPLVAGLLPSSKRPDQVNICFGGAETAGFAVWRGDRALPYEVPAMGRPLSGGLVARVGDSDGAALAIPSCCE